VANPVRILDGSTDISNFVDWKSIDAVAQITKDVGTLRFNVLQNAANLSAVTVPVVGDSIYLYDSTGLVWAGTVTETEATTEGLMLTWQITCTDWGYLFGGVLIRKNYTQMDPADIVADIVAQADPGGHKGFTTNHVQRGNFLVQTVKFNYQQPSKAMQSLANLIGWDWYIDPNKDIHFFLGDVDNAAGEGGTAPIVVNSTGGNTGSDIQWNSLDVDVNLTNMQNSVFVIGGTYIKTFTAATTLDTFATDGTRQFFSTSYPYFSPTSTNPYETPITVTLDGVPQTIGVANTTNPSTVQVLYNDQQRWIQFVAGAPGSGHTVKVYGGAKVPIIAHAYDSTSIGTYGEYQGVITDSKIASVAEAQQRAQAQILEFGHPVNDVKFNTLVPGCKIGQAITVDLPAFGINEQLIIKRIEMVGYAPGANGMLQYQIEAIGSDVVTFVDLMQSVLQLEANQTPVDDSTVNENLTYVTDELDVLDTVTVSGATQPYTWDNFRWDFFVWE
jgi:hypothetical protein